MIFPSPKTLSTRIVIFSAMAVGGINAVAAPLLQCHLRQGETVKDVKVVPTDEPYDVAALRINHFLFKPVVVGDADRVDYINLYTYYELDRKGTNHAYLLHQIKYSSPALQSSDNPSSLTGMVYLYEPRLGREFSYECALREEESSISPP